MLLLRDETCSQLLEANQAQTQPAAAEQLLVMERDAHFLRVKLTRLVT